MEEKLYHITINFCGFIGCDETYDVWAKDRDDAEEQALELAYQDVNIEEVTCEDDEDEEEE